MKIDARNQDCPKPVIMAKEALEKIGEEGILEILLNSEASKENVSRFLRQNGLEPSIKDEQNGEFLISAVKGYSCDVGIKENTKSKVMFIKSDYIGESGELGSKLIRGFLSALLHTSQKPSKIIFVNRGVLLTTKDENADVIATLKEVQKLGVQILSCGACLEFFKITNELKVGEIGNALDTVESLMSSDGVISL
ncbi:MAG: sulfurtransferase-like selenium metabolism protein YedF [Campylobacterales bacterium]|nr:sulfurtransferase-like selenium metabolism protein YedF [Campylobacterales bacterium]